MAAAPKFVEGQKAVGPNGQMVMYAGGKWYPVSATGAPVVPAGIGNAGGRGASKSGQSQQEQTKLNQLDDESAGANETRQQYLQARAAIRRLKPGPFRGALLDAAIPTEETSPLGRIGATILAPLTRWTGMVSDQDVNDYQRIKGLQSQRVQVLQRLQKGVQTEGDAARIKLGDISPNKTLDVNNQIINAGDAMAARVQGRAPFYTTWANKYGLNGLNEQGQSVEQAYQASMGQGPAAPAATPPTGWKVLP